MSISLQMIGKPFLRRSTSFFISSSGVYSFYTLELDLQHWHFLKIFNIN
jgi:hypothetical protein